MSVAPQSVPQLIWYDWAVIYAGLAFGIGVVFQTIAYSVVDEKKIKSKVYTASNFWLIMSGVIHVSIEKLSLIL